MGCADQGGRLFSFTTPDLFALEHTYANTPPSFNDWNFYTGIDANNTGNVFYVTKETAEQERLVFVNDAGRAIIKVDNTTDGRGNDTFGRNAVKMLTDWTFTEGHLVLFDAVHMPYGVREGT